MSKNASHPIHTVTRCAISQHDLGDDLTQNARTFALDVIANMIASRDSLHGQEEEYQARYIHLLKPHSYMVGDQGLFKSEGTKMKSEGTKMKGDFRTFGQSNSLI